MKLFHKTPEAHLLKTGINFTPFNSGEGFAIYLVKEGFGFVAGYFFKLRKTAKWKASFKAHFFTKKLVGEY